MSFRRFRIRTLMIAAAAVGVLLTLGVEARRLRRVSAEHRARATALAFEEERLRGDVERQESLRMAVADASAAPGSAPEQRALMEGKAEELRGEWEIVVRRLERVAALKRKYERAANRPWETVPPDTPGPR